MTLGRKIKPPTASVLDLDAVKNVPKRQRIDAMVSAFDNGESFQSLATRYGCTCGTVQGVLYRQGRTLNGRAAVRHQIETAVARVGREAADSAGAFEGQPGRAAVHAKESPPA